MTDETQRPSRPQRRAFTTALAAGGLAPAALLLSPDASASTSDLLTRKVPTTGEALPAVGLGTYLTFDLFPGRPRQHLREVMRRFRDGGGRVVDTSPLYGTAEINVGDLAAALEFGERMFVTDKIWATGEFLSDDSHARRSLEQSMQRLWRERIEVLQIHSLVNVDQMLPLLRNWKRDGRIGHIGVTHHDPEYYGPLGRFVERGEVEFVQLRYSIATRQAEERLLPAAADKGVAVLVNMPFEKARLFKLVAGRSVPDFAREAGIENWAQYFLKWILAHPAVTCVLPATSDPEHQSENIAALRGPLPDRALRDRMLKHLQAIPGFDRLEQMPIYPDKRYDGPIRRAMRERAATPR
jgi:diketogulonate reductase-like aldo/keto reductase